MSKQSVVSKFEARCALEAGAGLCICSASKGVKASARIGFGVVRMDTARSLVKELNLRAVGRNGTSVRWALV